MSLASQMRGGIAGVGVDVLNLARLRALIARRGSERLARRVCAPGDELDRYALAPEHKRLSYLALRCVCGRLSVGP